MNTKKNLKQIPKGTRDFLPQQMAVRDTILSCIKTTFQKYGGVEIDTPVFEFKNVLTEKYGEDSKLIYDLADQSKKKYSLRYDLTVPFARWMACRTNEYHQIKRFQIGKVYRRDNPAIERGRFREFIQCDFDIAGIYEPLMPDAEIICLVVDILTQLKIGDFTIKLNHRGLLDEMMKICGVPDILLRPVCSAIDKLDKISWQDGVRDEIITKLMSTIDKSKSIAIVEKIYDFIILNSIYPRKLITIINEKFGNNEKLQLILKEMSTLFDYLEAFDVLSNITFDLSLARGLDYYTGIIFEAVLLNSNGGSVAAGGRYDNLIGMFSSKQIPSVGVSIGFERIFNILEKQYKNMRSKKTCVWVASLYMNTHIKRIKMCKLLRDNGIAAETMLKANVNLSKQLEQANKIACPFAIIYLEPNKYQLKELMQERVANEEQKRFEGTWEEIFALLLQKLSNKN